MWLALSLTPSTHPDLSLHLRLLLCVCLQTKLSEICQSESPLGAVLLEYSPACPLSVAPCHHYLRPSLSGMYVLSLVYKILETELSVSRYFFHQSTSL